MGAIGIGLGIGVRSDRIVNPKVHESLPDGYLMEEDSESYLIEEDSENILIEE